MLLKWRRNAFWVDEINRLRERCLPKHLVERDLNQIDVSCGGFRVFSHLNNTACEMRYIEIIWLMVASDQNRSVEFI